MIPVLFRAVEREFLGHVSAGARAAFWCAGACVFAFILYWKGGLMVLHGKELEALAWFFLTVIVWSVIRVAEGLPERLRALGQKRLLAGLLFGIACFFLVMSLVDPFVQLGVQHVAFSSGLAVEVGFFVPAGAVLLWLSRRLR
jgi:hypothetical protein